MKTQKRKIMLLFFSLIVVTIYSSHSYALPLLPNVQFDPPPWITFGLPSPNYSQYDTDTGLFTASLGGPLVSSLYPLGGEYTGILDVSASINDSGNLLGGTVSWIGGSSDLGIPDGSLLFSGTIIELAYGMDPTTQFNFVIDIDSSHSSFGFGDYAALVLFHVPTFYDSNGDLLGLLPEEVPYADWFKYDFEASPSTHEDLFNVTIPEPNSILLVLIGVFSLISVRLSSVRNWRHVLCSQ